jgi:adenylate kinase
LIQQGQLFIFMGPPGSGKGSLSGLCSRELGWAQLSTGNLCRKHISEGTAIGKQIDFAIKSGKLIPDTLMTAMVGQWLESCTNIGGIILDGYPRTVAQAQSLNEFLAQPAMSRFSLKVIVLKIEDQKVIERVCGRAVCQNKDCQAVYSSIQAKLAPRIAMVCDVCQGSLIRRVDDVQETVYERLQSYHKHHQPLIEFYQQIGQPIVSLNVDKELHEIFHEFKKLYA